MAETEHFHFYYEKHVKFIKNIAADVSSFEYLVSQYLRMSGVYWGLSALRILGKNLQTEMDSASIIEWVLSCQDPKTGGFGGNTNHDPHMLYTLSALQILLLTDQLERIDKDKVAHYISTLQKPDGSFMGDVWGEVDTRFSYCALSSLSLLGKLQSGIINLDSAVQFVIRYSLAVYNPKLRYN
jgi:geranylgeranyl transferase type-2 subunit beta